MSTQFIGIKLGSINTSIYKPGNGVVLKESSLIAMPTNPKNKDVYAIGNDAFKIKNRLPQNIMIYSPISNGIIQYEDLTVTMLKHFLKKIFPNKIFGQNIKAILCVPVGLTQEENKSFEISCFKSGIAEVYLIPDVLCHAIGTGIDVSQEKATMVVDIGGNSTNIAIISNYSIIQGYNITIGGSIISSAICKYLSETYNIIINNDTAELIKKDICSLYENYQSSIEIEGYNIKSNSTEKIILSSKEFYPIIKYYYEKIANTINAIIKECNVQLVSDISENGINYYGNSSSITGLDKFMQQKTSFKSVVSNDQTANMVGVGELIKYPQLLHKILKNL